MSRRGHEAERNAQAEGDLNAYDTHPVAVSALMAVEALPRRIWEPAAGTGNIVNVLREAGRYVVASDILPLATGIDRVDFLKPPPEGFPLPDVQAIVTNPPFNQLRNDWVQTCLAFAPNVYLLARLQFLEGGSDWRREVLERSGLRRVYVFRERLPMMHKRGYLESGGKPSTSRMAFAWFCWRRGYRGKPSMHRISWRDHGPALPPPTIKMPKGRCRQTQDMFQRGETV
jgi:hypothetical protein